MEKQYTDTIVMIEPVSFGYNAETAINNHFQQKPVEHPDTIQEAALCEFRSMVKQLRDAGIRVITIQDSYEPLTPDSIFPNNWVSLHQNGVAVLYPMFAENRRKERRTDLFSVLKEEGYNYKKQISLTSYELQELYLEGTGSMVLDRTHRIAYASLSERTNEVVLNDFCSQMNYRPVAFTARQQVGNRRLAVYHTNVMMCVAEQYALVCMSSIDDSNDRMNLIEHLTETKKEIIDISVEQMHQFAGNMLQVRTTKGDLKLILSQSAFQSLHDTQVLRLSSFNELLVCEVPTIEKFGGGSVRCMIAEIF